ncbi:hypothetical protein LB505_011424 [Fusarium chuoi]|nr:hypothetical protein LB505_011424 [Fusarium chuoi]
MLAVRNRTKLIVGIDYGTTYSVLRSPMPQTSKTFTHGPNILARQLTSQNTATKLRHGSPSKMRILTSMKTHGAIKSNLV